MPVYGEGKVGDEKTRGAAAARLAWFEACGRAKPLRSTAALS
jgi:hypothetical protein